MTDRIIEMLDGSINEIFLKLQEEMGIEDGDIGFDAVYDIDRLTYKLAEVIAGAIEELKNRD